MFSKISKILAFSIVSMCALSSAAMAQSIEDLKSRLAEAAAMTKVDMDEALRLYLEIRVVYAGENVDYSLGRTYQRLFQCKEAQHYYTQVMVAYNLPDTNAVYQRAVKAYDEIAACNDWQKVYLTCEIPEGGYVMIDNERVARCWERPYTMQPGEHVFKLVDAKGKTEEKKIKTGISKPDAHIKLAFAPKEVNVEKVVEVEKTYVMKDKYSPALYWGLMTGGAALAAVGGFMSGIAFSAKADEEKYAARYAVLGEESDKKKVSDARDKVKLGNILMGTFVGIGGAAILTGATFAILNYVAGKELVEDNSINAYLSPSRDGISMGIGFQF